jgi:hypothetical protein
LPNPSLSSTTASGFIPEIGSELQYEKKLNTFLFYVKSILLRIKMQMQCHQAFLGWDSGSRPFFPLGPESLLNVTRSS